MHRLAKRSRIWAAAVLLVAATTTWYYLAHDISDQKCQQLAATLANLQATQEQTKIRYYYELKEHEVADDKAWRSASERIERELYDLTVALADCEHRR